MTKRKVVFFGNCQARQLSEVYRLHLAVDRDDQVFFANVQCVLTSKEEVIRALREADAVVSQIFDFPTKVDAETLRPGCVSFPSVVAGFYWPYANQVHVRTPKGEINPLYPGQLGDRFLNGLIIKGIDPRSALETYLNLDVAKVAGLDRLFELSMQNQRNRDNKCGFHVASLFEQHYRNEHLFLTSDHPNLLVFKAIARQVYAMVGISDARIEEALGRLSVSPFPKEALPIHPKVIEHFRLNFVSNETRYPFYQEGRLSFEEFVLRYMKYGWTEPLAQSFGHDDPPPARLEAPMTHPAAHPLDVLSESLKSRGGFYFEPTAGGVEGVQTRKVRSIELANSAEGPLLKLAGGDPQANSGGTTEGFSVRVPDAFEHLASERLVRVQVLARSAKAASTRLGLAYSTNEVGNSGWQWREIGPSWAICEMTFKVPKMINGNGDFIGLLPDKSNAPGVEIHSLGATVL